VSVPISTRGKLEAIDFDEHGLHLRGWVVSLDGRFVEASCHPLPTGI